MTWAGGCQVGQSTSLASGCANRWADHNYPNWDPGKTGRPFIKSNVKDGAIKVIEVNGPDHMVKIEFDYVCALGAEQCAKDSVEQDHPKETAWVHEDWLSCHPGNISTYREKLEFQRKQTNGDCSANSNKIFNPDLVMAQMESAKSLSKGFVAEALNIYRRTQGSAHQDMELLRSIYATRCKRNASEEDYFAIFASLTRAEDQIEKLHAKFSGQALFGADCKKSPDPSLGIGAIATVEGQRICVQLQKAKAFIANLEAGAMSQSQAQSDRNGAISAGKRFCAKYWGTQLSKPWIENDDLAYRTALFHGLDQNSQKKAASKLNLKRWVTEFAQAGAGPFWQLHNGYGFGGDGSAESGNRLDCTVMLAHLFHLQKKPDDGKGAVLPTTADYHALAMLKRGESSTTTRWSEALAPCFKLVDLKKGELPMPGDIGIERDVRANVAHAILIVGYDAENGEATTIEAAGSTTNTVAAGKSRPLLEPACSNGDVSPPRANLSVLRYDPRPNCSIK